MTPESETLIIESLSHDGRGIGHLPDGLTVFVSGALPGQKVRAAILQRKKSWVSARCEAVLEPAPDACAPLCPHHAACGGCPLQTMPYAAQLAHKKNVVQQALARIGHLDAATVAASFTGITPSPQIRSYRNKLTLAFGTEEGGQLCLGLRQEGSHVVTPVLRCALLPSCGEQVPLLMAYRLLDLARESGLAPEFWRFCTLRCDASAWWLVCLTGRGTADQRRAVRRMGEQLLGAFPQLAGFVHEERRKQDTLAIGEKRVCALGQATAIATGDPATMHIALGGQQFALDATSFFQVNTQAAQHLANVVSVMLAPYAGQGHTLLDCYCGVGAPGLCVAQGFAQVLGVEAQQISVAYATKNATNAGLEHCRYLAGDAGRVAAGWVRELKGKTTVALLDPPRAGLDQRLVDALLAIHPLAVVYVSCNPATLARDTALLTQGGYVLRRLHCVDLFPHTAHVESVALLTQA